ncbi:hydroquinone glucosyltransferase-like [Canna indica]|uniref:Glycosyltransferase n=1 Tax=Canna indica TaxID=4628 RepID=A0AAQ3JXJ4_9LILI|nr:hydroquinone glucosyltransferase-like [Canna indica]
MENGNGAAAAKQRRPHVAFHPTPGMGHLIPIVELSKLLVAHHGFDVTIITLAFSASKAQSDLLSSLPSPISSLALPSVSLDDLPADSRIETTMSVATARSLPSLRDALSGIKSSTNLVAFVGDLFGTDTFTVARELGLSHYMFFPSNLLTLSLLLHLPELDATTICEYGDLPEPLRLPGCVPIPGPDLLHPLLDRSNDAYRWVLHHAHRYREAEGYLVNSFDAIEPETAKILREPEPGRPPVYLVGPLTQKAKAADEDAECLRWLDQQPQESVLFVSFGSGGTLSKAQMTELALGLEMSGQRFLWVVRSPSDGGDTSEAYFSHQSKKDPFGFLPAGFVDRTREVGLLVPSWAPQVAVLNHAATGGFLSHCGWNSTLESVVAGVPMAAWPLFAEQRQNAVMLAEGARIALRPRGAAEGELVPREEVARVVRDLMDGEEGKEARQRVAELQKAGISGLEESGAAYRALDEVTKRWKSEAS